MLRQGCDHWSKLFSVTSICDDFMDSCSLPVIPLFFKKNGAAKKKEHLTFLYRVLHFTGIDPEIG
jgi:hypothetical protein